MQGFENFETVNIQQNVLKMHIGISENKRSKDARHNF